MIGLVLFIVGAATGAISSAVYLRKAVASAAEQLKAAEALKNESHAAVKIAEQTFAAATGILTEARRLNDKTTELAKGGAA